MTTTQLVTGCERMQAHVGDGVGWMIYANPARRNALALDMIEAVPGILRTLDEDPAVGVIVVTGAGTEAFVSGADISEFEQRRTTPDARALWDRAVAESFGAWAGIETPIVAAIRGWCLGAGMLAAMSADIRIAGTSARFGIPAVRLGVAYPPVGVARLHALVGSGWAAELLFTGRRIDAALAATIGLVNRAVADDELDAEIATLTAAIVGGAPLSVRASKTTLRDVAASPADRDPAAVAEAIDACFRSEDYADGQRAFMEKRTPHWRGR
jgi:enoyl-CoA hydratase